MRNKPHTNIGTIGRNTAPLFLTDSLTPYAAKIKAKNAAYEAKQKRKSLESLTPKQHTILKSALSQAFCGTSLLIECIDTIFEINGMEKHYPIFKDMQSEMEKLNRELYAISVKTDEDEENRVEFEKTIDGIIKTMPELNLKQIKLLSEFAVNLKEKS